MTHYKPRKVEDTFKNPTGPQTLKPLKTPTEVCPPRGAIRFDNSVPEFNIPICPLFHPPPHSTHSFLTGTISYLAHPTYSRLNQVVTETTNKEIHTEDTGGFTLCRNSLFIKSVSPAEALAFRDFV